jgi:hypothetical protein
MSLKNSKNWLNNLHSFKKNWKFTMFRILQRLIIPKEFLFRISQLKIMIIVLVLLEWFLSASNTMPFWIVVFIKNSECFLSIKNNLILVLLLKRRLSGLLLSLRIFILLLETIQRWMKWLRIDSLYPSLSIFISCQSKTLLLLFKNLEKSSL